MKIEIRSFMIFQERRKSLASNIMSTGIDSVIATSRLIVKNLPPKTNDEKLRQSFSGHGQITDIQLKFTKDGKFRNFAFVGYKTGDEAQRAQSYLNNSYFGASKIVSFGIWYDKVLNWSFKYLLKYLVR